MEIFLFWLVLSAVVGFLGSSRTIGFASGFFLSLILSPLIGFIFVILSKDKQTDAVEKKILSDQNAQQATIITTDEPVADINPEVYVPQKNNDKAFFTVIAIVIVVLAVLFLLVI